MMDKISPPQSNEDDLIGGGFGGFLYAHIEFEATDEDADVQDTESGAETDFSEYMWMQDEEEFDKTEMLRLEEEALMEECIEAMLHDELAEKDGWPQEEEESDLIELSTLNPLANEFVPVSSY